MVDLYKLTSKKHQTLGGLTWGPGQTHEVTEPKRRPTLCSDGVLHAYRDPDWAILVNPAHAAFGDYVLWHAQAPEVMVEGDGKVGVYELTTLEIVPKPSWARLKAKRALVGIDAYSYLLQDRPNELPLVREIAAAVRNRRTSYEVLAGFIETLSEAILAGFAVACLHDAWYALRDLVITETQRRTGCAIDLAWLLCRDLHIVTAKEAEYLPKLMARTLR